VLDSLITSKTRLKLLMKFFLNPGTSAYLRGLADEFGESTNSVRVELNRLSKAGFLETAEDEGDGRTRLYRANERHPLFPELQQIVRKVTGIDQVVEQIVSRLGNVELAFITGDYARGVDSGLIDLVLVGEIDRTYLDALVGKLEEIIRRKIRTLVLSVDELEPLRSRLGASRSLIVWNAGAREAGAPPATDGGTEVPRAPRRE
jgi:DNA-binding MarR family transcriptional regulator